MSIDIKKSSRVKYKTQPYLLICTINNSILKYEDRIFLKFDIDTLITVQTILVTQHCCLAVSAYFTSFFINNLLRKPNAPTRENIDKTLRAYTQSNTYNVRLYKTKNKNFGLRQKLNATKI